MPFPRRISAPAGALLAALIALAAAGCSGGNNNHAKPSTAAPAGSASAISAAAAGSSTPVAGGSPATAPGGGTPVTAACPIPSATRPPATIPSIPTPNPELTAAFQRLSPLLLMTEDLPPAFRDFQASGLVPVSNDDYVRGQPNAECLLDLLKSTGRTGGAIASWSKTGTYMPGQHTPTALIDTCSQFPTPDDAKKGLDFVFSQASTPPPNPAARFTVGPLDAGSYGDETRAVRVDSTGLVSANAPGGGTPVIVNVRQTFSNISWRRGTAVCSLQASAVDEDPPLADLKALAQLQDQRLKDGGY